MLIRRAQGRTRGGRRLLVSTSSGGGAGPREHVVRAADYLLLHGNGVGDPDRITDLVRRTRQVPGYRPVPILFNEDDHFELDRPHNNLAAAVGAYCSWGHFDPGKNDHRDGFQSPPANWGITTPRKRAFFETVREITGERAAPPAPVPNQGAGRRVADFPSRARSLSSGRCCSRPGGRRRERDRAAHPGGRRDLDAVPLLGKAVATVSSRW
jgi:hypothetical protein